jgi:hypothetical protein
MKITEENLNIDDYERIPVIRPEIKEGTLVYLDNKNHPCYNNKAVIIARDHRHYRIKFLEGSLKDKMLWCPEHWIEPAKNIL